MNNQRKHAYLIIAHNNFKILNTLLQLIDDERNDIYLHIGSDIQVNPDIFLDKCDRANIYLADKRFNVRWGHSSMVDVTLSLLKQARQTDRQYSYYHLISGVDLPLKTQEYIHNFFNKNNGREYITCEYSDKWLHRFKYYHILRGIQRKRGSILGKILTGGDLISVHIQKILRVNRIKEGVKIYKGSQWFSITDNFVSYLLSREEEINKLIRFSLCADESFIQTIIMDSPFKNSLAETNMRLIDWERGEPYTFQIDDLTELVNSEMLFARKFDENTDFKVVLKLSNHLQNQTTNIDTSNKMK